MAQLSRPYQIGLIVVALFAAVFVFALHGRSSSPGSPSAPAPAAPASTPASTPAAQASANGGSTGSAAEQAALSHHVYRGSAPGVGGLSRAIAKAHGAAATSQKNNAQLEQKSAQASSVTASSTTTSTPAGSVTKHSVVVTHAPATPSAAASTTAASATGAAATKAPAAGPARQRAVEAELKQGKIVVLLFWNPRGTDDRVVHHQLKLMFAFHNNPATAKAEVVRHAGKFFGRNFNHTVVVHETLGASVAAYGSITRGVQVYGTPTLLILNSTGKTITLTGVTDAYGIEQAIFEAHGG
jgi:hypothetical protein